MTETWITDTIAPKSDQLNADDLMTGPIIVKVLSVSRGSQDQPVTITIDGDRQPYKPCKSMRRVLVKMWGTDTTAWAGRHMQLYCDPNVMWAGKKVGGIRISHLSDISGPETVQLTVTKAKREAFTVQPLQRPEASAQQRAPSVAERVDRAVVAYRDCDTTEQLQKLDKHIDALVEVSTDEQTERINGVRNAAIERCQPNG